MEVRAKKALGQHFLTDQSIAQRIVEALTPPGDGVVPGSGVAAKATSDSCGATNVPGSGEPVAGVPGDGVAAKATSDSCGAANVPGDGEPVAGVPGDGVVPGSCVAAKATNRKTAVLEVGPGMGVLSQYLLLREDIDLKMIEIDSESVDYLLSHFPAANGRVIFGDFLKMDLGAVMGPRFEVIGNFPYNISSQIFFRILDNKDAIPEVVCMIQKEVAERIAEKPGTKTYGILSVLLQAWYDIEYLFTVGPGAFCPPPKVQSAVIRLRRNSRTELGCDEALFKTVVKTAFGQRRKTLRNSLKPLVAASGGNATTAQIWDLRPERLSVEDFIALTRLFEKYASDSRIFRKDQFL